MTDNEIQYGKLINGTYLRIKGTIELLNLLEGLPKDNKDEILRYISLLETKYMKLESNIINLHEQLKKVHIYSL